MSIDEEIQREYSKMKTENIVDEATTMNMKNKFADSLLNGTLGQELQNCNRYTVQSRPLRIPFKIKFRNFVNKLKNVLWN